MDVPHIVLGLGKEDDGREEGEFPNGMEVADIRRMDAKPLRRLKRKPKQEVPVSAPFQRSLFFN